MSGWRHLYHPLKIQLMFKRIYYWIHARYAQPQERGRYSAGYWSDKVRTEALRLCRESTGRLLEVGCGEGLFLMRLAKENPRMEIWGADNDPGRLAESERNLGRGNFKEINLLLQGAQKLDFDNGYFDAVVCLNTLFNLESMDEFKKTILEMSRVCRQKGRVIFDFRNKRNLFINLKYKLAPLYDATVKNHPLKTHELNELLPILEAAGLEIIRKVAIGGQRIENAPIIILDLKKK